jgi:hypothetical protein
MTKQPLVLCLTADALALLTNRGSAQSVKDPHLPSGKAQPSLNDFIEVDDMRLSPEQFRTLTTPVTSHPQGTVLGLGLTAGYFDWGVIPYQLAPNFSDAERQRILDAMQVWMRVAPVTFVPRTTQVGALLVTHDEVMAVGTACFSQIGQTARAQPSRTNLGSGCTGSRTILHELGHALGLFHEQSRPDRDNYVTVDLSNVAPAAQSNFARFNLPLVGPYDYRSIMHYSAFEFALDRSRPVLVPKDGSLLNVIGTLPEPSETDHNVLALLYNSQVHESAVRTPTESVKRRFDRGDMLVAMERLNAFYISRLGLQRPQGLSIDGKPDFLGIAQWIFDIYLPARSAGFSTEGAFDIVTAAITRSDEWRRKNPGRTALTPASFSPAVSLNRDEFLDVLNHLDRFYSAPEGLQRPNGLSISGGPDFLGIATWIFDIYLSERLNGISPNGAWTVTENAIRNTDEWRSKH